MKAKKFRRLSMDLTKDRGGHVKVLSPWGFDYSMTIFDTPKRDDIPRTSVGQ